MEEVCLGHGFACGTAGAQQRRTSQRHPLGSPTWSEARQPRQSGPQGSASVAMSSAKAYQHKQGAISTRDRESLITISLTWGEVITQSDTSASLLSPLGQTCNWDTPYMSPVLNALGEQGFIILYFDFFGLRS